MFVAIDIHAAIRARLAELSLRRADLARRCQELHPRSPRHWEAQISRLLGPEDEPRDGGANVETLTVILTALDLEVRPREIDRPAVD